MTRTVTNVGMLPEIYVPKIEGLAKLTVKAPAQVNGTGTAGSLQVPITAGYSGTLNTTALGLKAATVGAFTLKNPDGVSFPTTAPQANDHVAKFTAMSRRVRRTPGSPRSTGLSGGYRPGRLRLPGRNDHSARQQHRWLG
ncbi:hypothetical protein ACXC9Q_31330 [Kribbella sp. CWNU-51]